LHEGFRRGQALKLFELIFHRSRIDMRAVASAATIRPAPVRCWHDSEEHDLSRTGSDVIKEARKRIPGFRIDVEEEPCGD
jgi:hypothetical protein